jgi:general secretion pathway protein C
MSVDVVRIKQWAESISAGMLNRGLDKRIPVVVTFAVILLLTQSLATLTWTLVPVPDIASSASSLSARNRSRVPVPRPPQRLAEKIGQWHLFGKYVKNKPKPVAAPVQQIATAPETKLNLKLRGVFVSTNPKNASAIIADAKGKEESYKIGDDIAGRAILREVFNDKVILERNGRLETLLLPVENSITGLEIASSRRGGRPTSRRSGLSASNNALNPANSAEASALLRGYRDALISDPQSVMGLLRAEPFRKNGRLHGYRVRPGKDRQLLRKFGLRSGDVVTSVNGVTMNNPLKALEIMRDLSSATSLTVDIERRGVPQSFSFQLQ